MLAPIIIKYLQIFNWDLTHYILIKGLLSLNTFLPYIFNEIRRLNRSKRKELWRTTFSSAFTRQKRQLRLFRNWKHLWWKQLFFRRRSRNCALSVIKNVVLGRSLWIRQYKRRKGLVRRSCLIKQTNLLRQNIKTTNLGQSQTTLLEMFGCELNIEILECDTLPCTNQGGHEH